MFRDDNKRRVCTYGKIIQSSFSVFFVGEADATRNLSRDDTSAL